MISRPASAANLASSVFHSRSRLPLDSAGIGGDQQPPRIRVGGLTDRVPPATDRLDRELAGVSAGPHVHPASIGGHVVHPVRHRLAQVLVSEVVHIHRARRPRGLPLRPAIGEVADQFLLLRVHRDDRVARRLERRHLRVDVPELCIPVRVLLSLDGLGVALQAVAGLLQQPGHRHRGHRVPARGQLTCQMRRGLGRPPQRRLRVSPRLRVHQRIQCRHQPRIGLLHRRPAPLRRTRPSGSIPDSSSPAPRDTVSALAAAALATSFTPPRPIARASAPSSSRHCRSSRCGLISASLAASRSCSCAKIAIPQRYGFISDKHD